MANSLYSIWIFLLLGAEAIKTYRSNPFIEYVDYSTNPHCLRSIANCLTESVHTKSQRGFHLLSSLSSRPSSCPIQVSWATFVVLQLDTYVCSLPFPPFYIFQLNFVAGGLGYIKFLAPPEKILRWIEGKLNLLGRLPHYVSVDQKTYGRYGVLPSSSTAGPGEHPMGWIGSTQRLGA